MFLLKYLCFVGWFGFLEGSKGYFVFESKSFEFSVLLTGSFNSFLILTLSIDS